MNDKAQAVVTANNRTTPAAQEKAVESDSPGMSKQRAAFERLVVQRVNKALEAMTSITYLANQSAYEYNNADVDHITASLQAGVDKVKATFADPKAAKTVFKL